MMTKFAVVPILLCLGTAACLSEADYGEIRMRDPFGWASRSCESAAKDRVIDLGGGNPYAHQEYVDQRGTTYSFKGKVEYRVSRRSQSDPPESQRPRRSVRYYCVVRDGEVTTLDLGNL